MPPKSKKEKNPFAALDEDFRSSMEAATDDEIRMRISRAALDEAENQDNKEADQDLANKKAEAEEAGKQYADATKANKLRIRFCRQLLKSRGKE